MHRCIHIFYCTDLNLSGYVVCLSASCVTFPQHCKIYLCGTKNDLVEGDRSLRQIDYHDAQDFAEGIYSLAVTRMKPLSLPRCSAALT